MKLIHSTCVQMNGQGVLLRGPSGSGKSDLALRLIMRGARLVADDYVHLGAENGVLYAAAPDEIGGKLEVRGLGILAFPHCRVSPVTAIVDLVSAPIDRLPPPREEMIEGVSLPCFQVNPFEESSCDKILILLQGASLKLMTIAG